MKGLIIIFSLVTIEVIYLTVKDSRSCKVFGVEGYSARVASSFILYGKVSTQ